MTDLTKKTCSACQVGTPPLTSQQIVEYATDLGGDWKVLNEHHLEKEYFFKDFKEALVFTNLLGNLAEVEGHHPDIHLSWGKVRVLIWTHKINGLTESDFIFAAKCDQVLSQK